MRDISLPPGKCDEQTPALVDMRRADGSKRARAAKTTKGRRHMHAAARLAAGHCATGTDLPRCAQTNDEKSARRTSDDLRERRAREDLMVRRVRWCFSSHQMYSFIRYLSREPAMKPSRSCRTSVA